MIPPARFSLLLLALLGLALSPASAEVRIVTDPEGRHTLLRHGEPYLVKGANWPVAATIAELVAAGGNSVRSYGAEIEWLLPLARQHGLTVMLGLEIGRERQGFDYGDAAAVAAQRERIVATVRRLKNEPEILFWALGNEPELAAQNTIPLWREVGELARLVRAEDPSRPIVTVVAGFDERKIRELVQHCPDLDALGVNWYGPATRWPDQLLAYGWTKPYLITEFGPLGYWPSEDNRPPTAWNAPVEQHSTEKAVLYAATWQEGVLRRPGQSLGGYAFVWYWKQERTPTWFSMFLSTGERTEAVDAMRLAWTGQPHPQPAPRIETFGALDPLDAVAPGAEIRVGLRHSSTRPAHLTVTVRHEVKILSVGGDVEPEAAEVPAVVWREIPDGVAFAAPAEPGAYRVFFQITTDDATAAVANLPFLVVDANPAPTTAAEATASAISAD